jgi:hypothetical protein
MRISQKNGLFALFSVLLFLSCEEDLDPNSDLNFKCGNLFADTAWDAYLDECGGCDIDTREFNSMCFLATTSGFYLFEWPEGCMEGSEVLLVVDGESTILKTNFYFSDSPKRRFIEDNLWANNLRDNYVIIPPVDAESPALLDSCITSQSLIPTITFDEEAFEYPRFHEEMTGEFIWNTETGEEFKRSEVTFRLQELPEVRRRYDE